jgi:hypothetical protein
MGTRMCFVTRSNPEAGEKSLYIKGGEIALSIWPNASAKALDPEAHKWIKSMQTILANERDVQIVFAEGDCITAAYMIGDIAKGLAMLNGSKISPYVVLELLRDLDKAVETKAAYDAPPRSTPARSRGEKRSLKENPGFLSCLTPLRGVTFIAEDYKSARGG